MKTCPRCGTQYEDANTLCPADGAVLKKDDALVGNTLTDKYRIDEKIAEGGMGCVYRATHVLMEKTVAIKVLHPALAADDKIVARFTREAKAASRISHPHALTVTDFGEDKGGVVFLVMEYLRGRTLKETIRADGPLALSRVVEIVRQVCGALEAAHAEGVVHRDLKSDNIMLEESSAGDWAKVLDFGIAKIKETAGNTDPALTAPNLIIGTPQYMSPEQCSQASEIDSRSDIYSLGVIIFEMLAGHVPFTGDSPTAIMMKHLQEPPPSVLDERPDLPPEVGRVVARSLAKNPDERFQKAGQLSDALAQAAAEAVTPAPTTRRHDTDRIIVPTSDNEPPRVTDSNVAFDEDEATVVSGEVVSPRSGDTGESLPPFIAERQAPPPAQGFNPWRVALPAIAALAVIFAVVYALQTRRSNNQTQPLPTDPNSQPVQSITPPTGSAETSVTPAPDGGSGGVPNYDPNAGQIVNTQTITNSNQSGGGGGGPAEATPTPAQRGGAANTNQDAGPEEEEEPEEEPTPQPTPTPSNRNSNRRAPVVNNNTDDDDPPPPPPPARKEPPASETKPAVKIESDDAPPAP